MSRRSRGSAQILHLDPTVCDAHGFCADLLPEVIELDEFGFPVLAGGALKVEVPEGLLGPARRAVAACPLAALRLARADAGH